MKAFDTAHLGSGTELLLKADITLLVAENTGFASFIADRLPIIKNQVHLLNQINYTDIITKKTDDRKDETEVSNICNQIHLEADRLFLRILQMRDKNVFSPIVRCRKFISKETTDEQIQHP